MRSSRILNFEFLYFVFTIDTVGFSSSKLSHSSCISYVVDFLLLLYSLFPPFPNLPSHFPLLPQNSSSPTHSCSLAFSFPCLHFLCALSVSSLDTHKSLYFGLMFELSFKSFGLNVHYFYYYRFFYQIYWHSLARRQFFCRRYYLLRQRIERLWRAADGRGFL